MLYLIFGFVYKSGWHRTKFVYEFTVKYQPGSRYSNYHTQQYEWPSPGNNAWFRDAPGILCVF